MRFWADENILLVQEAFSPLGEVIPFQGRNFPGVDFREGDGLLIRSVTKVNPQTLGGKRPALVATASSGTDHVDTKFLTREKIPFFSAPGSNANSVAEYVILALCRDAISRGAPLSGKTAAVIGCGQVGSRVIEKCRQLAMNIIPVDPPLEKIKPDCYGFQSLSDCREADIITVHVPLTRTGDHPTWFFLDEEFFQSLKRRPLFINTSRGRVVREKTLVNVLEKNLIRDAVLDVYENEPLLTETLLERSFVVTPHIAGYSFDGKIKATAMICEAAKKELGLSRVWNHREQLYREMENEIKSHPGSSTMEGDRIVPSKQETLTLGKTDPLILEKVVIHASAPVYRLERDVLRFKRHFRSTSKVRWPACFDALRRDYFKRFEWRHVRVDRWPGLPEEVKEKLVGLGFSSSS